MKVLIERTGEEKIVPFKGTVNGLLVKLSINPESVIVARKGELLTQDDAVAEDDELEVLSVVSGG